MEHLVSHMDKVERHDKRLAKKIKEAFVGKNTWSHHKVRLGRQVAETIWGVVRHAVPGGDVADKAVQAIRMAGQFYLNREIAAGRKVSTVARDLLDVNNTTIHTKMEALFEHLESIVLWQREFEKTSAKGINSPKEQYYLIQCYTKLLTHYRDAHAVSVELKAIFADEHRKLEAFLETWALENRARSPIFRLENQLLTSVLFDAEVHNHYCIPETCYLSSNPVNAVDFYTQYLVLDPVDPGTFQRLSQTWLTEDALTPLLKDFAWFDGLGRRPAAAEYAPRLTRARPDQPVIGLDAWRGLLAFKGKAILSGSYLTKQNFMLLSADKDWYGRQQSRLPESEMLRRTLALSTGDGLMDARGWKDYSSIWGFRGNETQGVDNAYAQYVELARTQLPRATMVSDGQLIDAGLRAQLSTLVDERLRRLGQLSSQTLQFINAKAANASSQRRPFIQILDTLVRREELQLGLVSASLGGSGGGATSTIDAALADYASLHAEQVADVRALDARTAGTNLDVRLGIDELLKARSAKLKALESAVASYLTSNLASPQASRVPYVLMLDALLTKERETIDALKEAFGPAPAAGAGTP